MQREFRQTLIKLYKTMTQKRQFSTITLQALDHFLTYAEMEDQKSKEKESLDDVKSLKSVTSSKSTDSFTKIRRIFRTESAIKGVLFSYFLQMLKSRKIEKLNMVFKNISDIFKKYDKGLKPQERKRFLTKLIKFNQELLFLSSRIQNYCKIDWLYYQVFSGFQSQVHLFAQVASSFAQNLQSLENIINNNYCSLLASLNLRCLVYDYQNKLAQDYGNGDIKIYLGKKPDCYFISSENEHERAVMLGRKEQRQGAHAKNGQEVSRESNAPSNKFKEQFLSQMMKLKNDYDSNTNRIASLFNFKDSNYDEQKLSDEQQHI